MGGAAEQKRGYCNRYTQHENAHCLPSVLTFAPSFSTPETAEREQHPEDDHD
jgi:hypothetical protein